MSLSNGAMKKYPTIAPCGLECGFCPKYYTAGPSRCPGCAGPDFASKHPSCSFITCCVKKRNLEVCSECPDFPCKKFKSADEYLTAKDSPSYPPYRMVMSNLLLIKKNGVAKFVEQQKVRMKFLKIMIDKYDDGRSKSYYCRTAALLGPDMLKSSIDKANLEIKAGKIKPGDAKSRAKILRTILDAYLTKP
jgi:hypothetical protein